MPLAEIICWLLPSFDLLTQKAKVLTLLLVGALPNVFVRRCVAPDSNRSERVTGSDAPSCASEPPPPAEAGLFQSADAKSAI